MTVMELKFYNETTQQWENMYATQDELNTNILRINDLEVRYPKFTTITQNWNWVNVTGKYTGSDITNNRPFDGMAVGSYIAHDNTSGVLEVTSISEPYLKAYRSKTGGTWSGWRIVDTARRRRTDVLFEGVLTTGSAALNVPSDVTNFKTYYDELAIQTSLMYGTGSEQMKTHILLPLYEGDNCLFGDTGSVIYLGASAPVTYWLAGRVVFSAKTVDVRYNRKFTGGNSNIGEDVQDNVIRKVVGIKYV